MTSSPQDPSRDESSSPDDQTPSSEQHDETSTEAAGSQRFSDQNGNDNDSGRRYEEQLAQNADHPSPGSRPVDDQPTVQPGGQHYGSQPSGAQYGSQPGGQQFGSQQTQPGHQAQPGQYAQSDQHSHAGTYSQPNDYGQTGNYGQSGGYGQPGPYGQAGTHGQNVHYAQNAQSAQGADYGAQPGGYGQSSEPGFFKSLFDFRFERFVAVRWAGIIYLISVIVAALWWLGAVVTAIGIGAAASRATYWNPEPEFNAWPLIIAILFGWIVPALWVIFVRLVLELIVSSVRTAEHTKRIADSTGN
ncbi:MULTISPECIES: DUF4282 domain-containing protein [Brevibacterium]|uniref:DUF4282 domain-containing protein n=1 Tax=Brevibacterium metallidurans TaxID=1482676 RepID=A0ABN0SMS4_9MICO